MRSAVLCSAAVCCFASASWGQGFKRMEASASGDSQICVTWNQREVLYRVDAAGSSKTPGEAEFTAIDAAFAGWQSRVSSCSDFIFTRGARVTNPLVGSGGPAGENALTFRETSCATLTDPCVADGSCANTFHCWEHSDTTVALTTVTFSKRTGVVYDGDIEFNAAPHFDGTSFLFTTISNPPCVTGMESANCTAWDVQNTATHEIGHLLGFDHVDEPDSTMAPTADIGDTQKRIIDNGTLDGFCLTYPRGQAPVPCDELASKRRQLIGTNTGTFGCACTSLNRGEGTLLLLALIGFMSRRKSC